MNLRRNKIIALVVLGVLFLFMVSVFAVQANVFESLVTFAKNSSDDKESIFDLSGQDSDSDKLSDKEEYNIGTNPYNSDSDGDGYTDAEEVEYGFDPLVMESSALVDLDGDGLSGEDEKRFGTNPKKYDSDYDGYPDGVEVISGNDPLQASFAFLKPAFEDVAKIKESCEDGNCSDDINSEDIEVGSATPEDIENIFNAQNFSEIDPSTLSSLGIDSSKLSLDEDVSITEISTESIIITDDTSAEYIQDYFNIIGIILYSNSPVRSVEEAESYAQGVDIMNKQQVGEMKSIVSKMRREFEETPVPNKPEFIEFHKDVLGSAVTLEGLFNDLKNINFDNNDALYPVVNLLPKFSSLGDIIFSSVVPEAERLASESGVSLPDRNFLETYK